MKTVEAWNKLGFLVKKGSKSTKKASTGRALFGRDQVEKMTPKRHSWSDKGYSPAQEYSDADYEYDRDFGDYHFHDRDWY